jgi:hypothetical protein
MRVFSGQENSARKKGAAEMKVATVGRRGKKQRILGAVQEFRACSMPALSSYFSSFEAQIMPQESETPFISPL